MDRCPKCFAEMTTGGCPVCVQTISTIPPGLHVRPHTCPVCNGTALVSRPPHVAGDVPLWSSDSAGPWPCGACRGTGIVWSSA